MINIGDPILIKEGYVNGNKETNIENTTTTVFDIESVIKQFTAANASIFKALLAIISSTKRIRETVVGNKNEKNNRHINPHSSNL